MPDDKDYKESALSRAASTRRKADWEYRNRNLYGDEEGESGKTVANEISKKAGDIARINAKRASGYGKGPLA